MSLSINTLLLLLLFPLLTFLLEDLLSTSCSRRAVALGGSVDILGWKKIVLDSSWMDWFSDILCFVFLCSLLMQLAETLGLKKHCGLGYLPFQEDGYSDTGSLVCRIHFLSTPSRCFLDVFHDKDQEQDKSQAY